LKKPKLSVKELLSVRKFMDQFLNIRQGAVTASIAFHADVQISGLAAVL